jgi:hypothetical protein
MPVVTKYMACESFDPATEECTAVVWVDPPAVLPRLSAAEGMQLGAWIAAFWVACAVVGPLLRKGAS